jgi:hypothetical protein
MNIRSRQSGMTMWGLVMIAFLVVIFALLLIKLVPAYLADLKIGSALTSLQRQAQTGMSNAEILTALEKRFDIDQVTHVDLRQDLTITRRGRVKVIRIAYETQIPLVFNISALLTFDHSAEVPSGE